MGGRYFRQPFLESTMTKALNVVEQVKTECIYLCLCEETFEYTEEDHLMKLIDKILKLNPNAFFLCYIDANHK